MSCWSSLLPKMSASIPTAKNTLTAASHGYGTLRAIAWNCGSLRARRGKGLRLNKGLNHKWFEARLVWPAWRLRGLGLGLGLGLHGVRTRQDRLVRLLARFLPAGL